LGDLVGGRRDADEGIAPTTAAGGRGVKEGHAVVEPGIRRAGGVRVDRGEGRTIRLPASFDAEALARLLDLEEER